MNESQIRTYVALHGSLPAERIYSRLRAAASEGQLHAGVQGAHADHGGVPTPQHVLDTDDKRYGPEATFTQGPDGRDSMWAGPSPQFGSKAHADTPPWRTRPAEQGTQLPLGTEGAFRPTDHLQHFVRLKHPHLAADYEFHARGDDFEGHEIMAYHRGIDNHGEAALNQVGFLRWSGANGDEEHAPGEIQGVSVHPDHQGKEISTAMWDYARAHVAVNRLQEPVHSKDRSTAGNHWAHFVGGAAMPRTEGADTPEYFPDHWRTHDRLTNVARSRP